MQVNDLIFKELIKRGYSLEGKTRVWNIADSKLWYLTPEQAQAYLDLEDSHHYKTEVIEKEIKLIEKNLPEMIKKLNNHPVNIIDLGCGDGKKAVIFLKCLRDKLKLRYCPVDISDYMIGKAIERVKKMDVGEVIEFQWNVSDFENLENITRLLRKGEFNRNFLLLLGNTLGNFEINELLYEVRSAMKEGDFLLIGNGLNNKNINEMLKAYEDKLQNELMIKILTQIGFKSGDLEFGVRFRNSRVEAYYTIKSDMKLTFLDRTIYFSKGDQIIVAVSYKYQEEEMREYLKLYFDDVKVYVSSDKAYALAMCRK